jgi:HSP20 family protein
MANLPSKNASHGAPSMFPRDPFHSFREEMNTLFDRAFGKSLSFLDPAATSWGAGSITPRIDIHETDKEITLTAELPGVDEKDVDLSVHDGVLTLKGEKRYEKKEGEGDARVVERHYGSFSRSFTLPSGVDEAKISAKYDKGVLSVVLPKRPEAEAATRRIAIGK